MSPVRQALGFLSLPAYRLETQGIPPSLGIDQERRHTESRHRPLGGGGINIPHPAHFQTPEVHWAITYIPVSASSPPNSTDDQRHFVAQKAGERRSPFSTGTPGPKSSPASQDLSVSGRAPLLNFGSISFLYFFPKISKTS